MGVVNIKSKKEKSSTIDTPGWVETKHTIPPNDEKGIEIDLSYIKGWKELTKAQQLYLFEYSRNEMSKTYAAMLNGIDTRVVDRWLKDDMFAKVFQDISNLHIEAVERLNYNASFKEQNAASRNRFLEAYSPTYAKKVPNFQQNNYYLGGRSLADMQQSFLEKNQNDKTSKLTPHSEDAEIIDND